MSRSLRRGAVAAASLLLLPLALTACAAGNNAETGKIRPDNAEVTDGAIKVQNALIITADKGGEETASVSARVFNSDTEPQTLEELTIPGTSAKVKLRPAGGGGGELTVPAGGSLMLGGEGNPSALISGGVSDLTDGNTHNLLFQFDRTGKVELAAMVVPAVGTYAEFGPSAAASAPGASASPSASPSPSESASAEQATDAGTEDAAPGDATASPQASE
ncbi:DUF461 domain-containing protein [Streptomyces sp. NPDC051940]|uniref:DUF461 domain-containing protein n=1 Tax=Streptomyces sp. NPDC051940 TaxID=3155675 RepID=UPI003412B044